jgi:hypothetical protein
MGLLQSPFLRDRRVAVRRRVIWSGRSVIAAAACAAIVVLAGWFAVEICAAGWSEAWPIDMAAQAGLAPLLMFGAAPLVWRLLADVEERPVLPGGRVAAAAREATGPPPPASPAEAAERLSSAARETIDPRGYRPPAPPLRTGPSTPPGASPVHWVTAIMFWAIAAVLGLVVVGLLKEPPGSENAGRLTWPEYFAGAGLLGLAAVGFAAAGKLVLGINRREWVRDQARRGRVCPRCLYDVRGSLGGSCPECGAEIPVVESSAEAAARLEGR